jgi:hypothetical protein
MAVSLMASAKLMPSFPLPRLCQGGRGAAPECAAGNGLRCPRPRETPCNESGHYSVTRAPRACTSRMGTGYTELRSKRT